MKDAAVGAIAPVQDASTVKQPFSGLLLAGLKAHWIFFAIAAVYLVGAVGVKIMLGGNAAFDVGRMARDIVGATLPAILLAITTLRFGHLALFVRPRHPLPALARDVKDYLTDPRRLANGLPMTLAMFLFMFAFLAVKPNIAALNPFSWDVTFMRWDAAVHFGLQPWQILQPVLGYPPVSFVINVAYNSWFMVMWMTWCWMAFQRHSSPLRTQFFLAFMLSWLIGGGALALVFSSAGPVYYAALGNMPDPYAGLLDYLRQTDQVLPIWALDVQRLLWAGYTGEIGTSYGISAMPSMHNASALLFAFAGWRASRAFGIALGVFALLVLIGSVHLAWHYAIDGYAGFVIAAAAWWIAGRITPWYLNLPQVRAYSRRLDALS